MKIIVLWVIAVFASNIPNEFYLKKEFDQLRSIYEKEDPEIVGMLTALELPHNWDALMSSSKHLPAKMFSQMIKTIHAFQNTVLPPRSMNGKKSSITDTEGEEMQGVYDAGMELEKQVLALSESASAEDVATAVTRWLLHLKKHEAFWQRHNYNIPRLLSTLKYLLRNAVAAYKDIKREDAEGEVVRESLKDLDKEIGAKWDWQWIVVFAISGVCLLLLLISSLIFFIRYRSN